MDNITEKNNNCSIGGYVCLYKALFTAEYKHISNDAKLLYTFMLDRRNLSAKNEWKNENGEEYIYFTIDSARELLNVGKNKAIGLYKELEDAGFIIRYKSCHGHADKIVVKNISSLMGLKIKPDEFDFQTAEVYNSNPNNPESNNLELSVSSIGIFKSNPIEKAEKRLNEELTHEKEIKIHTDIRRERYVHAYLTNKLSFEKFFDPSDLALVKSGFKSFTDAVIKNLTSILSDPSFEVDDKWQFVNGDDSGYAYDKYLKAKNIKEKIDELSEHDNLYDWVYNCFVCWNGIINAKSENGDPVRNKNRYFPKFFQSYLIGDYDLCAIDEKANGKTDKRFIAKTSWEHKYGSLIYHTHKAKSDISSYSIFGMMLPNNNNDEGICDSYLRRDYSDKEIYAREEDYQNVVKKREEALKKIAMYNA